MKALILNSGVGRRMGVLTSEHPKCMTDIAPSESILSRQLRLLSDAGITEIVMTTGYFDEILVNYCKSLELPLHYTFVNNPLFASTNYIYSIYCARDSLRDADIVLLHGDMVFEPTVLDAVLDHDGSCMTVSSTVELPEKDFKAVVRDGFIRRVGVDFFTDAMAAQPLYKLQKADWAVWMAAISAYCESGDAGRRACYAENALNDVSDRCFIAALDVQNALCAEVDTPQDLAVVSAKLREVTSRTVYMCFSTDILHSGHIAIIRRAAKLGSLTVGVLSDEAVISYKRFPLMPFAERMALLSSITGVKRAVPQRALSYRENLEKYKPTYVVHGDDWVSGFQRPIRDEVVSVLASYGGRLVEYPYATDAKYRELEARAKAELSLPDIRRGRLKKVMAMKGLVTAMEAHSGLTGLIVENTVVHQDGKSCQFDAIWISSLCDSAAKGKPDIEVVDMTSRFRTIDDVMEVTTKPIIFDGDTGGMPEHFIYTVKSLERMGVSMIIIEDKTGLKMNSLLGTRAGQEQDSVQAFAAKITAGKKAQHSKDFMIVARIESLILDKGMDDALARAFAYVRAGADGIMIHSRRTAPDEVFAFVDAFRARDAVTPLVVVPTTFNTVTEDEFKRRGVNMVIYANQLTRSAFPAMQNTATSILQNHRAAECERALMPIQDIISLIPGE